MSTYALQVRAENQPLIAVPQDFFMRLSVAEYHQMIEAEILTPDHKVELLEGWLVSKMPKNPPRSAATTLTRDALIALLPAGWYIPSQEPVTFVDSEPEPDLMVVRGAARDYLDRHPGPQDVALVIGVADATLARDQKLKKRIYARAGIAVYWIVNLRARRVEVYSAPTADEASANYQNRQYYGVAEEVPVLIESRELGRIKAGDLLP